MDWQEGLVGRRLGRYEIHRMLSRTGKVPCTYRGQNEKGQAVAISVFKNDPIGRQHFEAAFAEQARVTNWLLHPAKPDPMKRGSRIVVCSDFACDDKDYAYLVRPYVEGMTLKDALHNAGHYSHLGIAFGMAIIYACRIAEALQFAHEQGVFHGDLEPSHLLIPKKNPRQILLGGFGLADIIHAYDPNTLIIGEPHHGTYSYWAPEQFTGEPIGSWTDVYALACVIFEVLAGKPPFGNLSTYHEAQNTDVVHRVPEMWRITRARQYEGIDQEAMHRVIGILGRALEREAGDRYQAAGQFAEALYPYTKLRLPGLYHTASFGVLRSKATGGASYRQQRTVADQGATDATIQRAAIRPTVRPIHQAETTPANPGASCATNSPVSIFLSHSSEDDVVVNRLATDLRAAGATVWVDQDDHSPGPIPRILGEALSHCDWLVPILSPAALEFGWVELECSAMIYRMANNRTSRIIPFIVEDCRGYEVSPLLEMQRGFNVRELGYDRSLAGLLSMLGLVSSESSHRATAEDKPTQRPHHPEGTGHSYKHTE